MVEDRRVLAAEAILSGAATAEHSRDTAIEALVRQHSRMVYRIAYSVLRQHHDAEDATQETFMRVLRYSSKLADVEDPKTWLARIAWRVAADRSRRRNRSEIPLEDPDKPIPEIAASGVSAEEAFQSSQSGEAIEKMIAALPEKLRAPLILSAVQQLSPQEIGATLNINEAAVRSRIFRARQILKERISRVVHGRGQWQGRHR